MLKRDLGVACLTNTEREIAEICKTNGLFDYFHKAFLSVDLGMQKPDREIYEEVARSVGCLPAEIFFVDDNMENVQAAIDVGMHGYLYCDVEKFWKALSCFCRLI
jgi:putative hydrolase of the HAD superfamily